VQLELVGKASYLGASEKVIFMLCILMFLKNQSILWNVSCIGRPQWHAFSSLWNTGTHSFHFG
jgi:hypothetical protein